MVGGQLRDCDVSSDGAGGNGLRVAEIENMEIVATGVDPMAAQYPGAHSTHTCGLYLAQWPQWSEFRNIDIRGVNTGIAMPALPGTVPAGLACGFESLGKHYDSGDAWIYCGGGFGQRTGQRGGDGGELGGDWGDHRLGWCWICRVTEWAGRCGTPWCSRRGLRCSRS